MTSSEPKNCLWIFCPQMTLHDIPKIPQIGVNYIFSGPCNYEYDFIIHNEDAADGNRFILWTMNNAHTKTHVPSAYRTHSTEEMLKPYRNISSVVLKQIYRNYYR